MNRDLMRVRRRTAILVGLAIFVLGLGSLPAQSQLLYVESFANGLGGMTATNGIEPTNSWHFRVNCPANALPGHSGVGAARWGNPADCANYGFTVIADADRLSTPEIDTEACGPGSVTLSFNYFLDFEDAPPSDQITVNAIVDGVTTRVADNGAVVDNLANGLATWQALSVPVPSGSTLVVEFIGFVVDHINNLAEGFLVDDVAVNCSARFDGFPDGTFDGDGETTVDVGTDPFGEAVAIQADGRIVVVGGVNTGSNIDMVIVRLNADGSLDGSFGVGGSVTVPFDLHADNEDRAQSVALQPDGKIVVAGHARTPGGFSFAVVRLDEDGALDGTFDGDGRVTVGITSFDFATGVAVQPDGKIVVVGGDNGEAIDGGNFAVVRLDSSGGLDPTFDGDGVLSIDFSGGTDQANGVVLQPDGKIVVGGLARVASIDFAVARLLADGTLDPDFGSGGQATVAFDFGGTNSDRGNAVAIGPSGSIVVVGSSSGENGSGAAIAQWTDEGVLDPAFDGDGKATIDGMLGRALVIQPDGKLVVGGSASPAGSLGSEIVLVRLVADGSLDPTFSADGIVVIGLDRGGSNNDSPAGVALQSDGSLVAAGQADNGPFPDRAIAVVRLGSVGSLFADGFESGDTLQW